MLTEWIVKEKYVKCIKIILRGVD